MAYRITALSREPFEHLFDLTDEMLASHGAVRLTALADRGYPCRISLEDAREGETLLLVHHVSHDVATPYRSAYAIYVRERAAPACPFFDCTPPVFEGRALSMRGFDSSGMLRSAHLAMPGEADSAIRALFGQDNIAYIHAHNAAHGCYAARIDRN